jgi:hypothetical protein
VANASESIILNTAQPKIVRYACHARLQMATRSLGLGAFHQPDHTAQRPVALNQDGAF